MTYIPQKKVLYKPSPKARDVWENAGRAKFRLLEGAVRSSKTYTANDLALFEIQKLPPCNVLISGYSISSVARNVISEWRKIIDPEDNGTIFKQIRDNKDEHLTINWRGLRGKNFYIRGAGKENDFKNIQGATFGYWLGDELTRHAETFTNMAISRLSLDFSKAIWTTNPDSPFHYLKVNFLEKPELFAEDANGNSLFRKWTFFLEDNPSLTDKYIQSLHQTYVGVFYKRYLLSQWCIAEGAIYDFFSEKIHVVPFKDLPQTSRYCVGIDYGTSGTTVFILFGLNLKYNVKPKIWACREYVWDAKQRGAQKTDAEFSADLKRWLSGVEPDNIYVDPSAASFKLQLRKDGFYGITDADNDLLNGIRTQGSMLKNGEYVIGDNCQRVILDYSGYSWDEKAQLRGEDKPVEDGKTEHTKDAERYPIYSLFGNYTLDYNKLVQW